MIAEVCWAYGWTMDYCLEMPAVQFFAMLNQARIRTAAERMHQCDITAIAKCDSKYFEFIRGRYERVAEACLGKEPEFNPYGESPYQQRGPVLDAASDEAKYFMMQTFTSYKQNRVH